MMHAHEHTAQHRPVLLLTMLTARAQQCVFGLRLHPTARNQHDGSPQSRTA